MGDPFAGFTAEEHETFWNYDYLTKTASLYTTKRHVFE